MTVHSVGAEPEKYTIESNLISMTVTEDVIKGNISVIKHTDDGSTQIETPEVGAEFEVYLKSAGSYENAAETERDYLTCDENGFAQTKDMPYGVYTVHQTVGWEGTEFIADFDVNISENGQPYRYLINNAEFESYVKVVKVDPKQIQKLAGYELVEESSGKHKGQTRISKRGRKRLRFLLFEAAMSLVSKNEEFREIHQYYISRKENPLKKMQSMIAVKNKLIRVFFVILKTGKDYDAQKLISDIRRPEPATAA